MMDESTQNYNLFQQLQGLGEDGNFPLDENAMQQIFHLLQQKMQENQFPGSMSAAAGGDQYMS